MALQAGRHLLSTERGAIVLRTGRAGLASQAGHDLTIEVARWSGELTLSEDLDLDGLEVRVDLGSLTVRDGSGGIKPLTDRDKREIVATARKVLAVDRHPEATFSAGQLERGAQGGGSGVISGTFTLHGVSRPLRLQISETAPGKYRATTSVAQTDHGIKPYSGFLGALKVRDAVDVEIEIDLAEAPKAPA
jgi:polyisoprenoid-binding protein YceI